MRILVVGAGAIAAISGQLLQPARRDVPGAPEARGGTAVMPRDKSRTGTSP